ncbi:7559_t:CDS:2 [Paraglomus occultum]|uniref:7559_t:CDS:1 n=1 Tax=Paraglomus occultum TaxID=144539 RepID=A0A9N9A595_9GLOM|nr:7559_t:CDS:2 [Paraglomus occultum]
MKAYIVLACSALIMAVTATLPTFTYNLTEKSLGDRTSICQLNMGFCSENCGGPDKAPKNFCNVTTMGWGCGCSTKVPDFEGYQWPINQQDCIGRGEACKKACDAADSACLNDSYYNVDNVTDIPTYGPPSNSSSNSTGSGSSGNSTTGGSSKPSSSTNLVYSIGSTLSALVVVAVGLMIL